MKLYGLSRSSLTEIGSLTTLRAREF